MTRSCAAVAIALAAGAVRAEQWVTEGFEGFRKGTFGNAGQNIYVSKAGVLQRIHLFDIDQNGYVDLPFANCQDHHESAPSYVYDIASGKRLAALPGQGSRSGLVADLDGDGIQDLVVCGYFDMVSPFASSDIYFGDKDGNYSQNRHIRLQTPHAFDCCVGRFDGGKPALAFAMTPHKVVRVYEQTDRGFEWRKFRDLDVRADLVTAADFDGDGFDDLAARMSDETKTIVYWGSAKGVDAKKFSVLRELSASEILQPEEEEAMQSELEKKFVDPRRLESVAWNGRKCFTLSTGKKMIFYSATKDRVLEKVFELEIAMVQSVASGDFNGDGFTDLAIACQAKDPKDAKRQNSFIYLGSKDGIAQENRIVLSTRNACSVEASGNLIAFAQSAVDRKYTNDALLFAFEKGALNPVPRRYEGENMHRAIVVRNPGMAPRLFVVNHYSRSAVGCDRAFLYWGDANGFDPKRRVEVPAWCGVDTLPADFDDDGHVELMVCNNAENSLNLDPGQFIHHFGPGGKFLPEKTEVLKSDIGWGAIAGDFDRDGYLDIISSAEHWFALRYFHGGPDGFKRFEDIEVQIDPDANKEPTSGDPGGRLAVSRNKMKHPGSGHARWPIAVDVNMDGWLDLVVPLIYEDRSYVLWGGPKGFSRENRLELAAYNCVSARAVDLDKNGYPEILLGGHACQPDGNSVYRSPHHSYVHIYWNGPDGLSESRKTILRADAGDSMSIADFDGNGWLDVFVGSYQGEIDRELNSFIYWNRGGKFEEFDRQELVTHVVSGCIAADFNEDGFVDLATANHKVYGDHVGVSYVWWNGKHGFCQQNVTKLPSCGPHGMCTYEPGNQLDRSPEEHYISEPHTMTADAAVASAKADGEVPAKTWTRLEMRVNGGTWQPAVGFRAKKGDTVQYRLSLGSVNSVSTPRITKVAIEFK